MPPEAQSHRPRVLVRRQLLGLQRGGHPGLVGAWVSLFCHAPGVADLFDEHVPARLVDHPAEVGAKNFVTSCAEEVTWMCASRFVLLDRETHDLEAVGAPALADERKRWRRRLQPLEGVADALVGVPEPRLVLGDPKRDVSVQAVLARPRGGLRGEALRLTRVLLDHHEVLVALDDCFDIGRLMAGLDEEAGWALAHRAILVDVYMEDEQAVVCAALAHDRDRRKSCAGRVEHVHLLVRFPERSLVARDSLDPRRASTLDPLDHVSGLPTVNGAETQSAGLFSARLIPLHKPVTHPADVLAQQDAARFLRRQWH